jgi:isoamylase
MYLNGHGIAGTNAVGEPIVDDHFLLYFNGGDSAVAVTLPPEEYSAAWDVVIDTAGATTDDETRHAGAMLKVESRSVVVLREHAEPEAAPDHSVAASVAALVEPAKPQTRPKRR